MIVDERRGRRDGREIQELMVGFALGLTPFFRSFFDEIVLSYPQLLMLRAAAPSHIVITRRIDLMMGTKKNSSRHLFFSAFNLMLREFGVFKKFHEFFSIFINLEN